MTGAGEEELVRLWPNGEIDFPEGPELLTAADRRRIRRAAARERIAQNDFQCLRTITVGMALQGLPLTDADRALVACGGGPVSRAHLVAAGVLQ